jgi:hypothetical protein
MDGMDDKADLERLLQQPPAEPYRYYGEYDENGVDVSLLRWLLTLTPLERLQLMERHARDTRLLNEYGRRSRQTSAPPVR